MQLKRPKLKGVDIDTLKRLVAENAKQRYALTEEPDPSDPEKHILWIRANQGHSLAVEDLEMHRIESPDECPIVVHGTFKRFWPIIQKEGLKVMNRHHIHCAAGLYGQEGVTSGELRALQTEDGAKCRFDVRSGMRASCDVFIYIDIQKAMAGESQPTV